MEKVIYRISLDVGRNGIQKTIQGIETGDVYAREIRITLRNGKENYELPTDNSVVAYMKVVKPSTSEGDPNACTIENGEIVYSVNATDFTEVGTTILQLELVESSPTGMTKRLIAPRFAVEVWESEIVAPSTTSQSSYTQLTSSLAQARAYYNKRFKEITVDDDNVVHVIFYNGTSTTDYTSDSLNAITGKIVDLEEDVDDLTTAMSGKADKTYVDSQDALKANKTYVDTELAKKANSYNPSTSGSFNHNGNIYADDLYYMDSNDSLDGGGFVIETHTSVKNAISGINTSLGNKVNKSNPSTTGTFVHSGYMSVIDGSLTADRLIYINSDEGEVNVETKIESVESSVSQNTADIAELKNTGITTTSTSPLNGCSASSIVGIDVDGCSTQDGTLVIGSFNYTWTSYSSVSGMFYTGNLFADYKPSDNNVKANIRCNIMNTITQADAIGGTRGIAIDRNGALIVSDTRLVGKSYTEINNVLNGLGAKVYTPYAPTPTNPIAIVDASGDVIAIGKNLFDASKSIVGTFDDSGNITTNVNSMLSDYISVDGGSRYTLSFVRSAEGIITRLFEYDANKNMISRLVRDADQTSGSKVDTFTTSANARYIRFCYYKNNTNLQIEYGTTATDYVAYASNKITLPTLRSVGTVKDELIVNSDGGSKTVKVGTVDIGTLNWKASSGGNGKYFADITYGESSGAIVCSAYPCEVSASYISGKITSRDNSGYMRICAWDETYTTVDAFKTAMSGVLLYYELATPTTTTLTASEVSAIRQLQTYSGTTIIDSALDVKSVTYHADTKQYIDEVDAKNNYSYTDTIVGKWADGKDLHRMVISATTPSTIGINRITNVIKGTDISLKNMYGVIHYDNTHIPLGTYNSSTYYISAYVDESGIEFSNGATKYCNCDCEIIVEYTLTDEATLSDDGIAVLSEGGDE